MQHERTLIVYFSLVRLHYVRLHQIFTARVTTHQGFHQSPTYWESFLQELMFCIYFNIPIYEL